MGDIREKVISDFTDSLYFENFRLNEDGGLEEREGYFSPGSFTAQVRGHTVYEGNAYFVSDRMVFTSNGTILRYVGRLRNCTFADSNEKVAMFEYGGLIHMIGGGNYHIYDPEEEMCYENPCYTPTIYYNDKDTGEDILHEPFNMVSRQVRLKRRIDENGLHYSLVGAPESIDEVLVDGVQLTAYTFLKDGEYSSINVTEPALVRDKEEIVITYTLTEEFLPGMKDTIFKSKNAFIHKSEFGVRLFLYDPDDITGTVYYSEPSHGTDGTVTSTFDYFSEFSFFTVGTGAKALLHLADLMGHALAFTKDETFEITHRDGTMETGLPTLCFGWELITNERGIAKDSGTYLYNDGLYLMTRTGLYRLSYNKLTYDFISAEIPIPKSVLSDRKLYSDVHLYFYRNYDELWLTLKGEAAVYNLRNKKWYRFTDITADGYFELNGVGGFYAGKSLFIFDRELKTDNASPITAVCETAVFDPDGIFDKKLLYSFGVCFDDITGAAVKCEVRGEKGAALTVRFDAAGIAAGAPTVQTSHARLSKSGYFKVKIESVGASAPANIRSLFLRYKNTGGRQ